MHLTNPQSHSDSRIQNGKKRVYYLSGTNLIQTLFLIFEMCGHEAWNRAWECDFMLTCDADGLPGAGWR